MASKVIINNVSGQITIDGSPISGGADLPTATEQGQFVTSNSSNTWVASRFIPTFKNRIINGDMRVAQRGSGPFQIVASTHVRGPDNIRGWSSVTGMTGDVYQSSISPSDFKNSFLYSIGTGASPTGQEFASVWCRIEGSLIYDFLWGTSDAKSVCLSFWVRSSISGTYCVSFVNQAQDRAYIAEYSIQQSNTWERKTITVPGDTSGIWRTNELTGLQIDFNLGCGPDRKTTPNSWTSGSGLRATNSQTNFCATSGANFYLTGVQLEIGSFATPFEMKTMAMELALCQRYYARLGGSQGYTFYGSGVAVSANQAYIYCKYPQAMRSAPTASYGATLSLYGGGSHYSISGFATSSFGTDTATIVVNTSGIPNAGGAYLLGANSSSTGYVEFSAEL